jgi:hypothetical protein
VVGSSSTAATLLVSCDRCGALHHPNDEFPLHPLCDRCRLDGSHALDARSIAAAVTETAPGSFVLGYLDGTTFVPFLVGRSDSDVRGALDAWVDAPSSPQRRCAHSIQPWSLPSLPPARFGGPAGHRVGVGVDTGYTHFVFRYAESAIAAFECECRDYHELAGGVGLDNGHHPTPPADSPWACPLHC